MTNQSELVRRIQTGISTANRFIAVGAGVCSSFIMFLIVLDIISRNFLGRSIHGVQEISILLLVMLIYLGFASAEHHDQHFRVDLLVERLPAGLQGMVRLATAACAFVLVAFFSYSTWIAAIRSIARQEATYGVISFPIWPSRLVIALGMTMFTLQLLLTCCKRWSGLRRQERGAVDSG